MASLPILLALAALVQPSPAPETPPCLVAQLYFDRDEFDEVAKAMLDRAVPRRGQPQNILIHASGVRYPEGFNGSAERSLRRGTMVRDHLIAQGLPAERIRVVGQDEGRRRFGNPGDGVVLVLIEYSRARIGMTVTGYAHHSSGCSTTVPRPFR